MRSVMFLKREDHQNLRVWAFSVQDVVVDALSMDGSATDDVLRRMGVEKFLKDLVGTKKFNSKAHPAVVT